MVITVIVTYIEYIKATKKKQIKELLLQLGNQFTIYQKNGLMTLVL
jgi:hypothetical protein